MAGRGLISAHRGPERSDRQRAGWLGAQASASRLASSTTLLTQSLRVAPGPQSLISKSYHQLPLLPLCSRACRHTGVCTCERVAPGQAEARGRVGAQWRVAGSRGGGREPVQKALEAMRCPRLLGEPEPGREPRMGPGTGALSEPVLGHAERAHPGACAKGNDGGPAGRGQPVSQGGKLRLWGCCSHSKSPCSQGRTGVTRARAVPTGAMLYLGWAPRASPAFSLRPLHLIWVWGQSGAGVVRVL